MSEHDEQRIFPPKTNEPQTLLDTGAGVTDETPPCEVDAALCLAIGQIALDHGDDWPMVQTLRDVRERLRSAPAPDDRRGDEPISDVARRLANDLNNCRRSWTMHIPVQDDDPDVIVYRLAAAYDELLAARAADAADAAEVARLRGLLGEAAKVLRLVPVRSQADSQWAFGVPELLVNIDAALKGGGE